MELHALPGGRGSSQEEPFPAVPFDFSDQPLRPGIAHECLSLTPEPRLLNRAEQVAAAEGLSIGQWSAITIESERVLRAAAARTHQPMEELERYFCSEAVNARASIMSRRGRRLNGYARALRSTSPREPLLLAGELRIAVPYHSLLAWELEATGAGELLERWAIGLLSSLPGGRVPWEAAAAEAGSVLEGWAVLQAARLANC